MIQRLGAAGVLASMIVAGGGVWNAGSESPTGGDANAGPFLVSIPVPGLRAEQQDAVAKVLWSVFGEHDIHEPKCEEGRLSFYFGGSGPEAMLRLRPLLDALKKAGLEVDTGKWNFEPQTIGLCLATNLAVGEKKIVEALKATRKVGVLGWVLVAGGVCLVVDLEKGFGPRDLEEVLEAAGVAVVDFAWGHWHHGYGIPESAHGHRHEVRATPRH